MCLWQSGYALCCPCHPVLRCPHPLTPLSSTCLPSRLTLLAPHVQVMGELRYLDKSVAIVLGFIGVKMLLGFVDFEVGTLGGLSTYCTCGLGHARLCKSGGA